MPFIELVSFTASNPLHDNPISSRAHSILNNLSACEGCLDIAQGREIENSGRVYFITTWTTYGLYERAAQSQIYASFVGYLIHHCASNPSVQHFEIDGDPHQALTAPVTEIAFLKSKAADWRWDQELHAGITGAKKGLPMVNGSYPPLRWGEVRNEAGSGSYCLLVGWDSIEAHLRGVREQPLRKHIKKIYQTTSLIDTRHINFRSVRRISDEPYFRDRPGNLQMQSSL